MTLSRVSVELIDADGSTYNANEYRLRLLYCIDKNRRFLKKLRYHPELLITSKAYVDQHIDTLMDQQERLDVTRLHLAKMEKTLLRRAKKKQQKNKDASSKRYADEELLTRYINGYVSSLMRLTPDLLGIIYVMANLRLVKHIIRHVDDADQVVVALGSNRQWASIDNYCRKKYRTGSIFFDLPFLQDGLQTLLKRKRVELEKVTLADAKKEGVFRPGEHFEAVLQGKAKVGKSFVDYSKAALIYYLSHHMAVTRKKAALEINLYDDQDEILTALIDLFSKHKTLLPKHTTLCLHHYDGGQIKRLAVVEGEGEIDECYDKNVGLMVAICRRAKLGKTRLHVASQLKVETFLSQRVTSHENKAVAVSQHFAAFFKPQPTFVDTLRPDDEAMASVLCS